MVREVSQFTYAIRTPHDARIPNRPLVDVALPTAEKRVDFCVSDSLRGSGTSQLADDDNPCQRTHYLSPIRLTRFAVNVHVTQLDQITCRRIAYRLD